MNQSFPWKRRNVSYYRLLRLLAKVRVKGQAAINQTHAGYGSLRLCTVTERLRFLKRMEFARSYRV